jgi:hypothetical protein
LQITRVLPIDSPLDALHHRAPALIFPFWASTSAFGIATNHPFIVVTADKPCPIGTKFWGNMGMMTSHLSASAGCSIGSKMQSTPADASFSEN